MTMNGSLLRRALAELLGTTLLVFFGPGAVVAALGLALGKRSLEYAGLGCIALSFGLVVALVIYTLGTTSGAHINPAVTVALEVTGRCRWAEVPAYAGAQVVCAVVGTFLAVVVPGTKAATTPGFGLTSTAPGVRPVQAMLAEELGTFLLLFTIMAVAVDRRAPVGGLAFSSAWPWSAGSSSSGRSPAVGQPRPHLRPLCRQCPVWWYDALGRTLDLRRRTGGRRCAGGFRV